LGERDIRTDTTTPTATDESADDRSAFARMAADFPVRTGIFTFGLPAFGLLQVINGFVHEGALLYIGLFAALVTAFSVTLTRYHLASYRKEELLGRSIGE